MYLKHMHPMYMYTLKEMTLNMTSRLVAVIGATIPLVLVVNSFQLLWIYCCDTAVSETIMSFVASLYEMHHHTSISNMPIHCDVIKRLMTQFQLSILKGRDGFQRVYISFVRFTLKQVYRIKYIHTQIQRRLHFLPQNYRPTRDKICCWLWPASVSEGNLWPRICVWWWSLPHM